MGACKQPCICDHHEQTHRNPHTGEGALHYRADREVSVESCEYSVREEHCAEELVEDDVHHHEVFLNEGVESLDIDQHTFENTSLPCCRLTGISMRQNNQLLH